MTLGDDELLEDLQRMMTPPPRQPSPESVAALRAAVQHRFASAPVRRLHRWPRPGRRAMAALAAMAVVVGTPVGAFAASGTPLPPPLRVALHTLGLPVDPVAVAATKSAESHLATALRRGDTAAVARDAHRLDADLRRLSPGQRASLVPRADTLLRQAAAAEVAAGTGPGQPTSPPAAAPTRPAPASATTTTTTTAAPTIPTITAPPDTRPGPRPSGTTTTSMATTATSAEATATTTTTTIVSAATPTSVKASSLLPPSSRRAASPPRRPAGS